MDAEEGASFVVCFRGREWVGCRPGGAAVPENAVVALGWFAGEVDDIAGMGKTVARNFDAIFSASKDCGGVRISLAGLAVKHEASARFGAGMLGEEQDARVGTLGGRAVAKPGSEGNAEGELGGDPAHVEDDGGEASCLEKEIGGAEGLVEAGPGFATRGHRAPGSGLR